MSYCKSLLIVAAFLFCSSSSLIAQNSLADEVASTYIGQLGKNGDKTDDYKIEIAKLTDTTVRISPSSGAGSTTFEASLSENMLGNIRTISFSTDADVMLQNATLVPTTGRFTYAIVNMSGGNRDIEIFNGNKE